MPTYIYRRRNGEAVEIVMTIAEMQKRQRKDGTILHGGETLHRDIVSEMSGRAPTSCSMWPMKSDAAGVHPSQIKEQREKSIRDGVPTDFTSDGRAIFTSAEHRARYLPTVGLFDKASFRSPKNR